MSETLPAAQHRKVVRLVDSRCHVLVRVPRRVAKEQVGPVGGYLSNHNSEATDETARSVIVITITITTIIIIIIVVTRTTGPGVIASR